MPRPAPPTAKQLIKALEVLERFAAHGLVAPTPTPKAPTKALE